MKYILLILCITLVGCENSDLNKQINQPKQIDTDNNNQETDQVIISDKDQNSILNNSILKNVLNSEDIVRCEDRYFKIKSKDLKLHLNGYEVIEFKNLKFEYNIRNTEDMTELERLNGLALEIKYNLSFNYFRNYIFKGLQKNNKNTYMIERANWSDWSRYGLLTIGVYSAYSNKQPEWSHNKSFRTTLPTCDEIIKATDSNYYLKKYADRINEINRWIAELQNLSYFVEATPNYNWDQDSKEIFYSKLNAINKIDCFVYDANGEFNQERITSCWESINSLKSKMDRYFKDTANVKDAATPCDVDASTRAQYTIKYPPAALRVGATGTVVIQVTYDANGTVLEASVYRSSRNRDLDRAALAGVRKWKINPCIKNGQRVGGTALTTVLTTVDFEL